MKYEGSRAARRWMNGVIEIYQEANALEDIQVESTANRDRRESENGRILRPKIGTRTRTRDVDRSRIDVI